jgi:hypothetical protein
MDNHMLQLQLQKTITAVFFASLLCSLISHLSSLSSLAHHLSPGLAYRRRIAQDFRPHLPFFLPAGAGA